MTSILKRAGPMIRSLAMPLVGGESHQGWIARRNVFEDIRHPDDTRRSFGVKSLTGRAEAAQERDSRLRLRVTAAAESIVRSGHPWLFAGSVRSQSRAGKIGELAVIYDREDRFLAVGLYDPDSPIRVRVLHAGKPRAIDEDWWRDRVGQAVSKRRGLFDGRTTGFR